MEDNSGLKNEVKEVENDKDKEVEEVEDVEDYRELYLLSTSPFLTPYPHPRLHPHRGIVLHPQWGSGIPTGIQ